jgi:signal transduction histidine kinase
LIENSLRHGAGPIELRALLAPSGVELHVRDRGPGFSDEFLDRAFERFARANRSRGGGAGLGLPIVLAIARAHGGEAAVANRPGGGADAWLALGCDGRCGRPPS